MARGEHGSPLQSAFPSILHLYPHFPTPIYISDVFPKSRGCFFFFFATPLHATRHSIWLSSITCPPPPPPLPAFPLCFRSHKCWRSKRRTRVGERKQREEGEGPSLAWSRPAYRPLGRSGAAPPVIIRVTAARARLCAACTRRDVLPRERSEHLSVPPCRQQPPTSLSNSIQVVTRSPNSYFP